jgi:polynucleotide 5'-kinase involved in rRNA processing
MKLSLFAGASYTILDRREEQAKNVGVLIWKEEVDEIVEEKYQKIVVLGKTDSGKSTFCAYLLNRYIDERGESVGFLDGDIGQSDLGPPGSISLGRVSEPLFDLRDCRSIMVEFVGKTSPAKVEGVLEQSLAKILSVGATSQPSSHGSSLEPLIVNTDGYLGLPGLRHKGSMIRRIDPDLVIVLEQTASHELGRDEESEGYGSLSNQIDHFVGQKNYETIRVAPAKLVSKDPFDREKRRLSQYQTWLRGSKTRKIALDNLSLSLFGKKFEKESAFGGTLNVLERRNSDDGSRLLVAAGGERSVVLLTRPYTAIVDVSAFEGMFVALADGGKVGGFGMCLELIGKNELRMSSPCQQFDEIILSSIGLERNLTKETPIKLYKY